MKTLFILFVNLILYFLQTHDENFDREETKFKSLEKTVRALVRDITTYLEQVQVKTSITPYSDRTRVGYH